MRLDLEHPSHLSWLKCSESEPIAKAEKKPWKWAPSTQTHSREVTHWNGSPGEGLRCPLVLHSDEGTRVCPPVFLHVVTLVPAVLVN